MTGESDETKWLLSAVWIHFLQIFDCSKPALCFSQFISNYEYPLDYTPPQRMSWIADYEHAIFSEDTETGNQKLTLKEKNPTLAASEEKPEINLDIYDEGNFGFVYGTNVDLLRTETEPSKHDQKRSSRLKQ